MAVNYYQWSNFPRALAPTSPDFYLCDEAYGQYMNKLDCKIASLNLPKGKRDVQYDVGFMTLNNKLPLTVETDPEERTYLSQP